MRLLAIDPGNEQSAIVAYDPENARPVWWTKDANHCVRLGGLGHAMVDPFTDTLAIEMIASYGMPVGREVFETCLWIGRFVENWMARGGSEPRLVYRRDVKLHLCGSARAKDANVRQALIDRYGPGKDLAIGRKASPGPLYGLTGDCWSALAVAVTASEAIA